MTRTRSTRSSNSFVNVSSIMARNSRSTCAWSTKEDGVKANRSKNVLFAYGPQHCGYADAEVLSNSSSGAASKQPTSPIVRHCHFCPATESDKRLYEPLSRHRCPDNRSPAISMVKWITTGICLCQRVSLFEMVRFGGDQALTAEVIVVHAKHLTIHDVRLSCRMCE